MAETVASSRSEKFASLPSGASALYSTYTPPRRPRPREMACGQASALVVGSHGRSFHSPPWNDMPVTPTMPKTTVSTSTMASATMDFVFVFFMRMLPFILFMGKWTVSGHPLSGAALQMERDVHRADVASPGDEPSAAIRAGQHRHGGMRWQGSRAVQRLLCGGCGCRGALRRGQSSRHHCRNTGRGQGRIPQKRIPGRRQAAASPAAEAPSGTQKRPHVPHASPRFLPSAEKRNLSPA